MGGFAGFGCADDQVYGIAPCCSSYNQYCGLETIPAIVCGTDTSGSACTLVGMELL
jgi:hypothetical protein